MPRFEIRSAQYIVAPLACMALSLLGAARAQAQSSSIVISQVYGGGGAATPVPFRCDFIELFNRGATAVDISTWSVQYASANGSSWSTAQTNLNSAGTLSPGQYLLIQQACGAVGSPLPITPDVIGTIAMSATAGKVALVSNQTGLPALNSFSQGQNGVVDIVSYGAANPTEGAATIAPTNMQAVARLDNGCRDTNDNNLDFAILAPPVPRNRQSPLNPCVATGACCISGACSQVTQATCAMNGGAYLGDGSICGNVPYVITIGANALEDISQTGAAGAAQGDNAMSAAINLPFAFMYFHASRSQYRYSTNGWFCFDSAQSDSAPANPTSLPQAGTPNAAVCPLWDDLASDTTGANRIFTQTLGTAPNRRFIIQYNNVRKVSNDLRYTFQAVLFESTQCIEFRYAAYPVPSANDAAVGLENNQGGIGNNIDPLSLSAGMSITLCPGTRCGVGACCLLTDCRLVNEPTCATVLGGVFVGMGSVCDPNPCVLGACCTGPMSCTEISPAQCAAANGEYRGDGSVCAMLDPPCAAVGACCVNVDCMILTESACAGLGGLYAGDGSTCNELTCAGACCRLDGSCLITTRSECLSQGGDFRGARTNCSTLDPPCAPAGACCTGITCQLRTMAGCAATGGMFLGENTDCTSRNPCAGACCGRDGMCQNTTEETCTTMGGIFQGTDTECGTLVIPCAPGGACCGANGSGVCTIMTEDACIAGGGAWRGENTTCSPNNPCEGACCQVDGTCDRTSASACSQQGGIYRGDNSDCQTLSPPCAAAGACCMTQGPCVRLTEAACMAGGGEYRGDHVDCQRDYASSFNNPAFVDISGFGTRLGIPDADDGSVAIALPFPLTFYGVPHASARVSVNGFITFGPTGTYFINTPIPDPADPNDTIYVLWDDLHLRTSGNVYTSTLGIAPQRVFIVQWNQVDQFMPSNLNNLMTFEAKLFESDQCIEFHYQNVVAESPVGDYTIGVENVTGTLATSVPGTSIGTGSTMWRFCPSLERCAGACCLSDGTCVEISELECAGRRGVFQGEAVRCTAVTCPIVCNCRGDLTGDGTLDGDDIDEFVSCVLSGGGGSQCACADVNNDLQINGADVTLFASLLVQSATCP